MAAKRRVHPDFIATGICYGPPGYAIRKYTAKSQHKALRKLESAFNYLRPRMVGSAGLDIPPNAEALAGSILASAMVHVVQERP